VEAAVRCPHCVSGSEFMAMVAVAVGCFVCEKCGHITAPSDKNFKCHCSMCVEMRSHVGKRRSS